MSVATMLTAAAEFFTGETDPRLAGRREVKAKIAELELDLLTLEEDRRERLALEARRAAADQRHAEACGKLQERLKTTSDPAERAEIRAKISAENDALDAECRACDANIKRLGATNDRRGKLSGELSVLRASLCRSPLACPNLSAKHYAMKDRREFCRGRVESWRGKVGQLEAALGQVAGRKFGPLAIGNLKPDGSQRAEPESEVAPLYRDRLNRYRAAFADAQEQLAAAERECNEVWAAIENE